MVECVSMAVHVVPASTVHYLVEVYKWHEQPMQIKNFITVQIYELKLGTVSNWKLRQSTAVFLEYYRCVRSRCLR